MVADTRNWGTRNCLRCSKTFAARGGRDMWCTVECRFWYHVDTSAGPDQCWHYATGDRHGMRKKMLRDMGGDNGSV